MRANRQSGFTYMAVLFAVAIAGLALASTGINWSHSAQREKERELLFVGNQFRQAIALYYHRTPDIVKRYPLSLDNLLEDKRQLSVQRYLRKIYRDPLTHQLEWGLAKSPSGGIMGVYSLSDAVPIKVAGFDAANQTFEGAHTYSEWLFSYIPDPR